MDWVRAGAVCVVVMGLGGVDATPAGAEPSATVADAVNQARGSRCGALTYSTEVERAAELINKSTVTYLNHTSENVAADSPHPMPILKELDIEAKNVHSLQGAGLVEADAIKGLLLEGYKTIPDCSYSEFGASRLYDAQSGYYSAVALLVQK